MTVALAYERMIAEQQAPEVEPDAPVMSQLRHALLHGASFTAAEVVDRWGISSTALSVIAADLVRAGFDIEREQLADRHVRISIRNLDHRPRPFTSRGTKTKPPAKKPKPAAAVEPAVEPKAGARPNWADELARLRAFHRAAPATPPLGTVVRVSMIAEDNGNAVLVLTDLAGARYFARMEDTAT